MNNTATFGFNTLRAPTVKVTMPLQPKAIHDETNATTFDEYVRMQANLGVEASPPTPGQQNATLYPFCRTRRPRSSARPTCQKADVTYDANGKAVSDVKSRPSQMRLTERRSGASLTMVSIRIRSTSTCTMCSLSTG